MINSAAVVSPFFFFLVASQRVDIAGFLKEWSTVVDWILAPVHFGNYEKKGKVL